MRLPEFEMERMQSTWEHRVRYDLSESGVEPLALGEAARLLVTTGTSEATFLALATLVEKGDDVVVVLPNYMQLHGLARGLGANVREVWLHEDEGWGRGHDRPGAAGPP